MTGLLILFLLLAIALGTMRLAGLRGPALTMAAAALMIGAAGYAWQGRPDLAGSPRLPAENFGPPPSLAAARHAFMGEFNQSERWMIIADSFASRGKTEDAVDAVRAGLRAHPGDYGLWIGLGNALSDHARTLTPAAELAFERAQQLAPTSPAPAYFLGLAELRSGQVDSALVRWRDLLERAPANAGWRPLVEGGVALIEQRIRPAMRARPDRPRSAPAG